MAKITMFVDYTSENPPLIPKPDCPVDPFIATARDGLFATYPEFQGVYLRIVHPANPKARSRNGALGMLYLPPHVGARSGPHATERVYQVWEGQACFTFAEGRREVKQGEFVFLPPGCEYALENAGAEPLEMLVAEAKPGLQVDDPAAPPEYRGYETDEIPTIPPANPVVRPTILSVREGVPVKYRGCDGLGIRVVHPVNPKAASHDMGFAMVYVPPQTVIQSGSHEPEENYLVLRGQGTMIFSNFQREVRKGTFVHLPAWCVHAFTNTGDETAVVLVIAAPPNP